MSGYGLEYFAARRKSPLARLSFDFLLSDLRASDHCLEVGAGAGDLATAARARCSKYIATDFAPYTQRLECMADAQSLPFMDRSFDRVVSMDTIEHLSNPQAHLREAARVLKPNGVYFFTTPNAEYSDPSMFYDPTHINVHNRQYWITEAREAGFKLTRITSVVPWLGHEKMLFTAARMSRIYPRDWRDGALLFARLTM